LYWTDEAKQRCTPFGKLAGDWRERESQLRYKSFILRIWRRQEVDGFEWAGNLASTRGRDVYRFRTLEELIGKLRQIAQADAREEAARHEPPIDDAGLCSRLRTQD
jgi:hypothetical protein